MGLNILGFGEGFVVRVWVGSSSWLLSAALFLLIFFLAA